MKDIILFGIQGSGKGTQAEKILEKFDKFAYLSTWDILELWSNDEKTQLAIISQTK